MIASKHVDCVFELDFDCENETKDLDREGSPVDIISQEDVLGALKRSTCIVVNDLQKIVELSVDVPNNGDRVLNLHHIGLLLWVETNVLKTCFAFLRS